MLSVYQCLRVKRNQHSSTSWQIGLTWESELEKNPEKCKRIKPRPQTPAFSVPSTPFATFLSFEERDLRHCSQSNTRLVFMWQNYSLSSRLQGDPGHCQPRVKPKSAAWQGGAFPPGCSFTQFFVQLLQLARSFVLFSEQREQGPDPLACRRGDRARRR